MLMKLTRLLIALIITSACFGQNTIVSTFMDNSISGFNQRIDQLHLLPWDESKLILRYIEFDSISIPETTAKVELFEVSTTQRVPFGIPGCDEIKNDVLFLDNAIIAPGIGSGFTHAVFYLDASTSVAFDFSGSLGLHARIQKVGDEIFIIGENNGYMELHRLDLNTLQLEQLTNQHNVARVCGSHNGVVYFQEIDDNGFGMVHNHRFYAVEFDSSNQVYTETLIESVDSEHYIRWSNPTEFSGELFFTEGGDYDSSTGATMSYSKLVSVNAQHQISDVFPFQDVSGIVNPVLFVYQNQLYTYRTGTQEVFVSPDGVNFYMLFSIGGMKGIAEHYLSQNDQLYFRKSDFWYDDEIFQWNQGYVEIYDGEHMHFQTEFNGIVYITDTHQSNDPQRLIMLNTQWNIVEEVDVDFGLHPSVEMAAVWYDNYFTFLFNYGISVSVMQLVDNATASLSDLENTSLKLYPNPVTSGDLLKIESNAAGAYEVISASGESICKGELIVGENEIELETLASGMYLLQSGGQTIRFTVIN